MGMSRTIVDYDLCWLVNDFSNTDLVLLSLGLNITRVLKCQEWQRGFVLLKSPQTIREDFLQIQDQN